MLNKKTLTLAVVAALAVAAPALAHNHGGSGKAHPKVTFEMLDANKDGGITLEELKAKMAAHPKKKLTSEKAAQITERKFKRLDKNNDGRIDKAEFEARRGKRERKGNSNSK